jgi:hypothetical protein
VRSSCSSVVIAQTNQLRLFFFVTRHRYRENQPQNVVLNPSNAEDHIRKLRRLEYWIEDTVYIGNWVERSEANEVSWWYSHLFSAVGLSLICVVRSSSADSVRLYSIHSVVFILLLYLTRTLILYFVLLLCGRAGIQAQFPRISPSTNTVC